MLLRWLKNVAPTMNPAAQILQAIQYPPAEGLDCLTPSELVYHIVSLHHKYLKEALPAASNMLHQVAARRAGRHPEMVLAAQVFNTYCVAMHDHMRRQEEWLFPLVCSQQYGQPTSHWLTSLKANIEPEHRKAKTILAGVRKILASTRPCADYQDILLSLKDLEEDGQLHLRAEMLLHNAQDQTALTWIKEVPSSGR